MGSKTRYFQAADITIQINSDYPIGEKTFHPKLNAFETKLSGEEHIVINHHFHPPEQNFKDQRLIYEKNQWQIFKSQNFWFYTYTPEPGESRFGSVSGRFSLDHSTTDIYLNISEKDYQNACFNSLSLFNSDQVLFARLLNNRNGLILHANGFEIEGRGILLTGHSGAGKSTLSHMLKQRNARILCDDRMFVRETGADFRAYGHWNHGSVSDVSSGSATLKAIFFLEQAKENRIIQMADKKAISLNLFQSVVKQFLTKEEWSTTFNTLEKMVNHIDCYILKFNLDGKITEQMFKLVTRYPV